MGEAGSRRGRRFVRDKKSSLANKFSPFFSIFFFFFFHRGEFSPGLCRCHGEE